MTWMFGSSRGFDRDIGSWDIGNLTNATDMFSFSRISPHNFTALLIGWATVDEDESDPPTGLYFGGLQFPWVCAAAAATAAIATLTDTYGWEIARIRHIPNCSDDASLSALSLDPGSLTEPFDPNITNYVARVANGTTRATVTPTATFDDANLYRDTPIATITVNGANVVTGRTSGDINLDIGANIITIAVTAQDGTRRTYTITVTRPRGPKMTS